MPDATLICNSYSSITNDDEAKIMIIRPPILAARLVGVTKIFDGQSVLDAVDLEIKSGEILVIIGPSGSGKTTLLRCIIGLTEIDSGLIEIAGELVVDARQGQNVRTIHTANNIRRQKLGMVFQSFNLFPHRTALENITEAPIFVRGVPKHVAIVEAERLLSQVGLGDRMGHYPAQLSGGQQQRVAIARALAMKPDIILFDEVTSALDPELVGEVLTVMQKLAEGGQTMIVVTHEMSFARQVGSRLVFMDRGRIVEQGLPPQLLDAPTHPRTQQFLSKVLRSD